MSPSSSVLEPEDGEPFARVHRAHYRGFVVDAPSVLPASLHDDVERAFDVVVKRRGKHRGRVHDETAVVRSMDARERFAVLGFEHGG